MIIFGKYMLTRHLEFLHLQHFCYDVVCLWVNFFVKTELANQKLKRQLTIASRS